MTALATAAPDRLDQPTVYGARAKLGVIVPPTNTANEAEWNRMAPEGVSIHAARMPLHTDTESDAGKKALYADVKRFAGDLGQAGVDIVAYGCTAGSMVNPVGALPEFISRETGRPAITTAQALVEALRALGAKTVSLATPYGRKLNDHETWFLTDNGFVVAAEEGLGYGDKGPEEYRNIARVPPDEVVALVRRVDRAEADAIVISCTDLASLDIIAPMEKELGKPVISSNQATFWLALRRAGIQDRLAGFGRLLEEH